MARNIFSKVLWVGRATSAVVGLAVILALILGVATAALGATSKAVPFNLGQINTSNAVSTLVGNVADTMLRVDNHSTAQGATALDLRVEAGQAPMKVNADAGTATNLKAADSQKLEGKQASEFAASTHPHSGADITSGTVDEARIDSAIARDGEIMPTVRANDGSGSGVDADTLDGRDSSSYLPGGSLPSGRTIRGVYSGTDQAVGSGEVQWAPISFGYSIPNNFVSHYIAVGQPTPQGCTGNVSDPGAEPGHVCVFEYNFANLQSRDVARLTGASSVGVMVHQVSAAQGFYGAWGTWAVTAP